MSITEPRPNWVYEVVEFAVVEEETGERTNYEGRQWREIHKLVNTLENDEDGMLETFGYEKGAISLVERVVNTLCHWTHDLIDREQRTLWERRQP